MTNYFLIWHALPPSNVGSPRVAIASLNCRHQSVAFHRRSPTRLGASPRATHASFTHHWQVNARPLARRATPLTRQRLVIALPTAIGTFALRLTNDSRPIRTSQPRPGELHDRDGSK